MDWVKEMEKKRRVQQREKQKQLELAEAARKQAESQTAAGKEQQRRMDAAKHASRTSICVKQFELPTAFVKVDTATTSDAEEWWNSTLNKGLSKEKVLWTPRMDNEVPDDIQGLVEAYGGKSVLRGYRGFSDDFPHEEQSKSYFEVMTDFHEHERLQRGRTSNIRGTEFARPDGTNDPMGSMRWLDRMTHVPLGMQSQSAAEKVKSLETLANMSEELDVTEASELVELGATAPIITIVNESEDPHIPKGIHQFLHGTKEGSAEQQFAYVSKVHTCAARALRNLLCILSSNFSLHAKSGAGRLGTITYDWLPTKFATFVDVIVTQPGMYELLFRLLVHESLEAQEHATFALLHIGHYSKANLNTMLETGGLLDLLCDRICCQTESLQEVSLQLLLTLMHSNEARKKVLLFKSRASREEAAATGAKLPQSSVMTALSKALKKGTDRSMGMACRIVWELCAKDGSQRTFRSLRKAKETEADDKKKGRNSKGAPTLSLSNTLVILGDGIEIDYVKQDVCREAGLLQGLTRLMKESGGTTLENACGAMWCLSLERANKRRIGLFPGVVEAFSNTIKSADSTERAKLIAANGLRNLATDSKTMDHMSVQDTTMVEQLINECEISKWQLAIVADM
mmetsp:Transcript_26668/g.52023  ORF Transcript_26668/g.52023 Transcript_26668/m.52023 type:complete len:628 (+) Transcript_26668:235-2118(+)